MVKINHSAKETNLSFYYQTLVGLDKCLLVWINVLN